MVTGIKNWDKVADNNTDIISGSDLASTIDNKVRTVIAEVREWYENSEWIDLGHSVTYASTTTFTISGDHRTQYCANRYIRLTDSSTLFGKITGSTYDNTNTTVTVVLDSGSLSSSLSAVALNASKYISSSILTPDIGMVAMFAMSSPSTNWLKCNGSAVSRATYSELFNAIGTSYGSGDGSTTFNLPDYRGEFLRGWDDGRGIDSGRTLGSSQTDELKSHKHSFSHAGFSGSGSEGFESGIGNFSYDTDYTGGSETRPRNISILFCIKYK